MKWYIIVLIIVIFFIGRSVVKSDYSKFDLGWWKDVDLIDNASYIPNASVMSILPQIDPILNEIGRCESGNTQFRKDGSLLRGKINQNDVGRFQINEVYWLKKAKELGFNIYTEVGNTRMALWIYKQKGTQPWSASKSCWNK